MKQKTNFKLKTLFLLSALFVFAIALALNSYAVIDCNLTVPSVITTGSEINASFNVSADGTTGNASVAFSMRATDTANSSFVIVQNLTNTSRLRAVNWTVPSLGFFSFEDSSSVQVSAICTLNQSGVMLGYMNDSQFSSSAVTLDRTIPQVPTSLQPANNIIQANQTLSAVGTVNGANTTSCTLRFVSLNPGQSVYSMTHSGNTCSQEISNVPEGTYQFFIRASDETNTTDSATSTISIDVKGSKARTVKIGAVLGGGASAENVGKGLAIAQNTRAGEVSQGLANAQIQINRFVEKETQPKELTKTGIGLGVGVTAGLLIPTLVIPGVGFITAPILGGLIGAGIGLGI